MIFNTKINQFTQKPIRKIQSPKLNNQLELELEFLQTSIIIDYETMQADELLIEKAFYVTEYRGEYLGVLDLFFQLLEGRAVEALDRITTKELDYYCRDDKAIPAFEYYNHEIYNILSIGEALLKKVMPSLEQSNTLLNKDVSFFDLSFSEQLELIEEVCSLSLYKKAKFADLEVDLVEVENSNIIISSNACFDLKELEQAFKNHLIPNEKFNLVLK